MNLLQFANQHSEESTIGILKHVASMLAEREERGLYYPQLTYTSVIITNYNVDVIFHDVAKEGYGMENILYELSPELDYIEDLIENLPDFRAITVENYLDNRMMHIEEFPDEIIREIAYGLPAKDLFRLCSGNHRLNSVVCDNEYFWYTKFVRDFDYDPVTTSWKTLYHEFPVAWGMGSNKEYVFGTRWYGTLEEPNIIDIDAPRRIFAGEESSAIIDEHNDVYVNGVTHDEVGYSTLHKMNIKAKSIIFGTNSTALIALDNTVYSYGTDFTKGSWGKDPYLRKPLPTKYKAKDVCIGIFTNLILDLEGNVIQNGINIPYLQEVLKGKRCIKISCNDKNTV